MRQDKAKKTNAASRGKRKTLKRRRIGACVVGAVFVVGCVALDDVRAENVAALRDDSNDAASQDAIKRGPVPWEEKGLGADTRIATRKIAPVYRKLIIGKDLSPEKIAGSLRSDVFAAPQYVTTGNWTHVIVNDEGEAVWSFFDEFEVDPEPPYFKAVDGVLLSKDGKTLYSYPATSRATTLRVPETVETLASRSIRSQYLVKIVAPSVRIVEEQAVEALNAKSIELSEKLEVVATNSFLIRKALDVGPVKIPNDAKVTRAKGAYACARLERFNGEPVEP